MSVLSKVAHAATNVSLLADVWSPWSTFDSPRFAAFHQRLIDRLPERVEQPIAELQAKDATREAVIAASKDFTSPLVVRGALAGSAAIGKWGEPAWWLERYPDAEVLCSGDAGSQMLPLRDALARHDLYVAGATTIFEHHPELAEMVETAITRAITPDVPENKAQFYQVFMGRKSQGTTVHCAIGINLFRQISGRKKWYFFPPSQTPYLYPKIYANGYSATSRTVQPHLGDAGAPWFSKLERFTITLGPGDLLVNPPWWWHCVENVPGDDELIVGVPTRYRAGRRALRVDRFKTLVAASRLLTGKSGLSRSGEQDPAAFERSLVANRAETAQQLVLRPVADRPLQWASPPDAVDWADRVFFDFRRLFDARNMVVTCALELDGPLNVASLRTRIEGMGPEVSRLRWILGDGSPPQWREDPTFDIARHVVETVVEAATLDDLIRSAGVREGALLDWRLPPWKLELVRNHVDPAQATLHAVRLCWDHAVTDMEGVLLLLVGLGDSDAPIPVPPRPAMIGAPQSGLSWLRSRLASRSPNALHASAGSRNVQWTRLPLVSMAQIDKLASDLSVTTRELLVSMSADAFRIYRKEQGEAPIRFDILSPSYSMRDPDAPLQLGNHRRQSTRFAVPPELDGLASIFDSIAHQASTARGTPYNMFGVLGRLPDRLIRRVLSKAVPPLIVNWDAPRLSERLLDLDGTAITDIAVAAPLLPHQQCSFIWWVRGGVLQCGLTTDHDLIVAPDQLAATLRRVVECVDEVRAR